jgi:glycosyltransferase involved in cell wall biosynthesis/Flp pilus assembly protein TadD/SAM-dependent methyltransferase
VSRSELVALVPPSARRVLEVGCGAGEVGAAVKARLPGCWVAGIELDRARAAQARHRLDEVVADAGAELAFTEPFDAIVLTDALCHLEDPRGLLLGLHAWLQPDGLLIAQAPAARTLQDLRRAVGEAPRARETPPRGYTRRELAGLLIQCAYDPTSLRALPDPHAGPVRLPLDGARASVDLGRVTLRDLSADELEALTARAFLLTAVHRLPGVPPDCSIILVADRLDEIRALVDTLRREPPRASREIIAVLGRGDGDRDGIPGVRLLANRAHPGRGAARNQGARHARGDYLAFLDGGTRPAAGWLDALLDTARRRPGTGAVGSRLLRPDGTIAHAGVAFGGRDLPLQPLPYRLYGGEPGSAPHATRGRRLSAVAGSGLLVSRPAFLAAGGLDEAFRTEVADVDLCLAIRARGLTVEYCPESVIEEPAWVAAAPDADDGVEFAARWSGRLLPDDGAICRADGTDRARAYGLPPPRPPASGAPPVLWTGHLLERGGYAQEARSFVLALVRAGIPVHGNPIVRAPMDAELPPALAGDLERALRRPPPDAFAHVVHAVPTVWAYESLAGALASVQQVRCWRHPRALRHIGRTMLETDRIPPDWVGPLNDMDEVWVPATFNVETFARSGVARDKLVVVPGPLPLDPVDASAPPLWDFSDFVFLSVFAWVWRKGWDALVRAYLEEFRREEPVLLLLHVSAATSGLPADDLRRHLWAFVRHELGRDPADGPPVALHGETLSVPDLARLYRAAGAFVLPTRGEGFGRPFLEAMAAGLPVIATRFGGHLDFVRDDNAYLIDCRLEDVPERMWREHPLYRGHRWGEPSVAHLRQLMRRVFEERGEAAARAARAREEVLDRFSWTRVAGVVGERLGIPREGPRPSAGDPAPVTLAWEGPQFVHFGLAVVNREVCRELAGAADVDLAVIAEPPAGPDAPGDARVEVLARRPPRRPVDVHVRHEWPPRFDPPPEGRWVMIQPWEFGALPRAWIDPMNRLVDEVWVPSQYVRTCFIRSGVDPRRVVVIPNGVDPARFRSDARPLELPTRKAFRFLFVGGTLPRKGADILLDTYVRSFRRDEDVCLVVKDLGADSFYRGQGLRDRIRALAADPGLPEIVYLDDDLPEDLLPGLYTACHCLVHPYRGEGFGIPILEAMACGLPVIVPGAGPALEVCTGETAYFVPAAERRLAASRVGGLDTVDRPWLAEVDREALAVAMRHVVGHPEEARDRGRRAAVRAREFAWSRAARLVRARTRRLAAQPIRRHAAAVPSRRRELSVCMIVRDEEARLPACLGSVRDVADEIIVLDTGSTDRTVEVARAHGARVFQGTWCDDWAAARNASIARASGDFILVIDADQTLDAGSRGELRRLIQHDAPVGYLLRQLNYLGEGTASVVEHLTVRLFPRHPAIRYAGRIHEQIVSLTPDLTLELVPCGVVLHHDGYRSAESRRRKAERDLPILERLSAEAPGDPFVAYNLGMTYQTLDRPADAEAALRRAITLGAPAAAGPDGGPGYLLTARVVLAVALLRQDRPAEAADACRDALARAPTLADAWCTLGAAELRLGRADGAAEAYRSALGSTAMPRAALTDRASAGWKAWAGMGEAELARGRWAQALACLERARALNPGGREVLEALARAVGEGLKHGPTDPAVHRNRGWLRAARGDLDGALDALRHALTLDGTDPATLAASGDVLLALGAPAEAEAAYRAALASHPGSVGARRGLEAARRARRAPAASPGHSTGSSTS